MNKKILIPILISCLLTAGSGCGKQANQAQAEARTPNVAVLKVAKEDLVTKTAVVAKISASQEVKIVPKTAGRVAQMYADVGQSVSAGQVLLQLDNSDIQLQLEKTRIQLDDANREVERKRLLFETGALSKQDYENAQSALATLTTTLRQNESDLSNTVIRSPISGIVANKNASIGEMVSTGTPAMVVVNIDKVEVTGNLLEAEINYVKFGQEVEVLVSAISTTPFKGRVTKISPTADATQKTYPIWVSIDNPGYSLKPGMYAEIQLETKKLTGVTVVPSEAVVERNGGQKVVYVAEGDKAVERPVVLGPVQEGKTVITEGLNEGDALIISGASSLKNGMTVKVQTNAPKEQPKG